jgi:hypothetical protein
MGSLINWPLGIRTIRYMRGLLIVVLAVLNSVEDEITLPAVDSKYPLGLDPLFLYVVLTAFAEPHVTSRHFGNNQPLST